MPSKCPEQLQRGIKCWQKYDVATPMTIRHRGGGLQRKDDTYLNAGRCCETDEKQLSYLNALIHSYTKISGRKGQSTPQYSSHSSQSGTRFDQGVSHHFRPDRHFLELLHNSFQRPQTCFLCSAAPWRWHVSIVSIRCISFWVWLVCWKCSECGVFNAALVSQSSAGEGNIRL